MRRNDILSNRTATATVSRARPNPARAAAAARLAGVAAGPEAVADRMRQAARRSTAASSPVAGSAALALAPARPRRAQPAPGDARPRHLRVVGNDGLSLAARRRRTRAALIASITAATAIALALVYLHVVLAQRQFAIDRLDTQLSQAQTTYQAERLQVAELSAPQHIISEAEGQLGMVQPASVDYLTPPAGSPSTPTQSAPLGDRNAPATVPASAAPAGDADWPVVKSELAGQP